MAPDIGKFLRGAAFEEVFGAKQYISVSALALQLGDLICQISAFQSPPGIADIVKIII